MPEVAGAEQVNFTVSPVSTDVGDTAKTGLTETRKCDVLQVSYMEVLYIKP